MMDNKELVLLAGKGGSGGGGSVTPAAIVTATEQMTEEQAADTLTNIGGVTSDDVDARMTPYTITMTHTSAIPGNGTWTSAKSWAQLVAAFSAGKPIHAIIVGLSLFGGRVVVTHMIGNQMVIYLTGDDDSQNHYDGFYMILPDGSFTYTDMTPAQDFLQLTATPTAGPSGNTLMSGTWSGATWEEVAAAVLASRLIQIDVATIGKITLLYNLGSATNASSNAFVYNVGGTLYNVFAELLISNGANQFRLSIINARTETENISGTTPNFTPAANTIYNCGELTSLTISNPPATGKYSIIFYSGATPTTTVGIANFTAEANKRYKITVEDNYATYDSWPYTPT